MNRPIWMSKSFTNSYEYNLGLVFHCRDFDTSTYDSLLYQNTLRCVYELKYVFINTYMFLYARECKIFICISDLIFRFY